MNIHTLKFAKNTRNNLVWFAREIYYIFTITNHDPPSTHTSTTTTTATITLLWRRLHYDYATTILKFNRLHKWWLLLQRRLLVAPHLGHSQHQPYHLQSLRGIMTTTSTTTTRLLPPTTMMMMGVYRLSVASYRNAWFRCHTARVQLIKL